MLEQAPRPPMAVTNAVSWRTEGIRYKKNEVFLDVVESLNLLVCLCFFFFFFCSRLAASRVKGTYVQANANGTVIRSEIVGAIKMRVFLSGMPELRLGLNDKVAFESSSRRMLRVQIEHCT
jgi:AP-1 complex subunit mu